MTTVKFDKAVKYQGVRYAAHEAFKVEDNDVAQLKAAGATVLATEEATTPPGPESADEGQEGAGTQEGQEEQNNEDVAQLKEELLDYTVAELSKFAQERGIDLMGKTRKADIYNIIVAALN